jgi:hypothetical protein
MKLLLVLAVASQAAFGHAKSPNETVTVSPPDKTVTVYHLFEPKYTGLAGKDAGDFLGEASFIFLTFSTFEADNPEASIQDNIMEMSTVTVDDWGTVYLKCNAPGAKYNGSHGEELNCPNSTSHYCCSGNRSEVTADTLPGYETNRMTGGGYWYSFPMESEGNKWTQKLERRIKGSCLGGAWRSAAGGCAECGADLDQCVATCIQKALTSGFPWHRDYSGLKPTWDKVWGDKTLCPDQPFPPTATAIVV